MFVYAPCVALHFPNDTESKDKDTAGSWLSLTHTEMTVIYFHCFTVCYLPL